MPVLKRPGFLQRRLAAKRGTHLTGSNIGWRLIDENLAALRQDVQLS